ncbi:arylformamidase [Ornithinibacillus halotolerans]|uniref:Kynurenine formamidase n=1 Tax=Ornithinibacillus halotolerans TaxID=1274357 RepID=A0A916WDS2_9BACI|nr:arylformamidase [Ornithinibacillus halotolerans]GGA88898.1 kynurenine formamidase [Ornithinibacillus halotolerans]
MTKWIDITQALTNDMAHWPGDRPFTFEVAATKEQTGSANVGKITTSVHMGTHVDAPFHFSNDGDTIDKIPIETYIGEAKVIDVSKYDSITPNVLEQFQLDGVKRLLLRTSLPNNPKYFPEEIPFLDPSIAPYLSELGILLLGVDMPSVDPITSKTLDTHHALHKHGIYILENLMLDHIDIGNYELIALPLKIVGADGSPVRAVLRPIKEDE